VKEFTRRRVEWRGRWGSVGRCGLEDGLYATYFQMSLQLARSKFENTGGLMEDGDLINL
jgi:hypothetical protein